MFYNGLGAWILIAALAASVLIIILAKRMGWWISPSKAKA
jgi:ESS family glutamate:Na+ symporter